jgi:hypothetical protein
MIVQVKVESRRASEFGVSINYIVIKIYRKLIYSREKSKDLFIKNLDIESTGWELTKLIMQIRKIFCNFMMLLQSNYPCRIDNVLTLQ